MKLTNPTSLPDATPDLDAEPVIGAAVITDARTGCAQIVPIEVVDFYEGWAA